MNNRLIIGVLGLKGAGKDTLAQILIKQYGFVRTAFADKLYKEVAEAFNVTTEYLGDRTFKETPRPELALKNCKDTAFVVAVMEELPLYYAKTTGFIGQLDLNDELTKPRSPRFCMQFWGTEYRRKKGDDAYWLKEVGRFLDTHPDKSVIITDVRFDNEGNYVTDPPHGGLLVRVRRPSLEAVTNLKDLHPSETEVLDRSVSFEFINAENQLDSLESQVVEFLKSLNFI